MRVPASRYGRQARLCPAADTAASPVATTPVRKKARSTAAAWVRAATNATASTATTAAGPHRPAASPVAAAAVPRPDAAGTVPTGSPTIVVAAMPGSPAPRCRRRTETCGGRRLRRSAATARRCQATRSVPASGYQRLWQRRRNRAGRSSPSASRTSMTTHARCGLSPATAGGRVRPARMPIPAPPATGPTTSRVANRCWRSAARSARRTVRYQRLRIATAAVQAIPSSAGTRSTGSRR